jgi:hypothetical protein
LPYLCFKNFLCTCRIVLFEMQCYCSSKLVSRFIGLPMECEASSITGSKQHIDEMAQIFILITGQLNVQIFLASFFFPVCNLLSTAMYYLKICIHTSSSYMCYQVKNESKKYKEPSHTRRWSSIKPNCYGCRNKTKSKKQDNSVEIEAYLKPSWV